MEKYLCQKCQNPIKISEGDFIYSFNINCKNGHNLENIDSDDLLSMRAKFDNDNLYQCQKHKKKYLIHCFTCDEDICFSCFNELHKGHKMEYIKNFKLTDEVRFTISNYFNIEKGVIDTFLKELMDFKQKFNIYINVLAKEIKNYHKLKKDIYNDISQNNISYIDIHNYQKFLEKNNMTKIINFASNFVNCETFLKKYDNLKDIFDLLVKKGKYIEEQKIKDYYKEFYDLKIIPINKKHFLCSNKYNEINLFENISNFQSKKMEYEIIHEIEFPIHLNDFQIVLKSNNDNINEKFSFYILQENQTYNYSTFELYEITINNMNNHNIKKIKTFNRKFQLFILSDNKYIINENNICITLCDNSFKNEQKIDIKADSFMKIDENIFVCLNQNSNELYIVKIEEMFIDKNSIKNCGTMLIYFSKRKQILFSGDYSYIYLINFKTFFPEVIQKIKVKFNKENIYSHNSFQNNSNYLTNFVKFFDFYNDDSFYIESNETIFKNFSKYNRTYLIQLKIIDGELFEVSRIIIKSKIIEK